MDTISRKPRRIRKIKSTYLWIATVFFALYGFTLIYPFIWMLINSFKNNGQYLDNSFGFPPSTWRFDNYVTAFTQFKVQGSSATFIQMILNSVLFSFLGAVISLVFSSMTAYVCAKFKFKFLKVIFTIGIITMILPIVGSLPAQYKLVSSLGLKNNILGIALLYGSPFGFNFIVLYGAFKSISWEYAEAAQMDGCGNFRIYLQIMMPMIAPILKSLFIIQFIGVWNDYMTPLLYLKKTPTISYGIYMYEQTMQYTGANYPIYFAGIIMALVPIIVLFSVFQKTLMENTVAGGLKG